MISAVDLLNGIGKYAGLEKIHVEGATGYTDTNYVGKAEQALAALKDMDFVFIHVEAPMKWDMRVPWPEKSVP
jgi:2,3-bisphosphoglycerate-independent phosphoglycerate mutase